MGEYINKKDLKNEFCHYVHCEKESEGLTLTEINEVIDRLPSADIVEVVRCENCKHWVTTAGNLIAPYCEKIGIKYDNGYRDYDDYCSYAERKDENE